MPSKNQAKPEKSYAELMQELNDIVGELERADIDVDAALELYERGIALTKQLDTYLTEREHKLTELKKLNKDG